MVKLTRREVIKKAWLTTAVVGSLCYPLFRFLGYRVPRKPRMVKIPRDLAAGGFAVETEFVLFQGPTKAWAVSRTCTHLGCRLTYQQQDNQLVCPCHHSRFTIDGTRIAGPARRNLPVFLVERQAGAPGDASGGGYIVTLTRG